MVWFPSELMKKLYLIFCDFMKIFLLNLKWRSIFWNIWRTYKYLYLGLLYNFYAIKLLLYEKYGKLYKYKSLILKILLIQISHKLNTKECFALHYHSWTCNKSHTLYQVIRLWSLNYTNDKNFFCCSRSMLIAQQFLYN